MLPAGRRPSGTSPGPSDVAQPVRESSSRSVRHRSGPRGVAHQYCPARADSLREMAEVISFHPRHVRWPRVRRLQLDAFDQRLDQVGHAEDRQERPRPRRGPVIPRPAAGRPGPRVRRHHATVTSHASGGRPSRPGSGRGPVFATCRSRPARRRLPGFVQHHAAWFQVPFDERRLPLVDHGRPVGLCPGRRAIASRADRRGDPGRGYARSSRR